MIKYEIVATGSSGNFIVLEKKIAIDAGVSYVKVEPYMEDLKLVLLTHRHGDHFKPSTVRRMALEKPKLLFGCGPYLVKELLDAGVPKRQIQVLKPKMLYPYGICQVIPVELEHDVPNYGYKIHFPDCKVFYATDMATLNGVVARGYDLYLVEANFEKAEIKERMDSKEAQGLYAYERRVVKYHMSKEGCDNLLVRKMGPSRGFVYLQWQ